MLNTFRNKWKLLYSQFEIALLSQHCACCTEITIEQQKWPKPALMLPPHVLRERQRKVSHFTSMCCCAKGTALQAAVLEKPLVTLVTLPGSHPNHHKKTTTTLHQLLALFVLQAQGRSSKRCYRSRVFKHCIQSGLVCLWSHQCKTTSAPLWPPNRSSALPERKKATV